MALRRPLWILPALVSLVLACGAQRVPPAPDLTGRWVLDETRLTELYDVVSMPKGPERDRSVARIRRTQADLTVVFGAESVTLSVADVKRELPFRIVGSYGPLVYLEGLQGTEVVTTTVKLDRDQLTWFDAAGEVEFVLRRGETPQTPGS